MVLASAAGSCCLRLCLLAVVSGLLLWRAGHCQGEVNGFINFAQTRLIVDEGPATQSFTTVSIPLVREGGTTGNVFATLTIIGGTGDDFLGTNVAVAFASGVTEASATVVIRNDAVPEGNETFTVEITGARFGAEVGETNTMQLIIRANDEPYGSFQFDSASLVREVSEPATGETNIQLTVRRGPGIFGRVTVDYEVQGSSGLDDLTPSQGQLVFEDQVASQTLTLAVLSDNLPEPDEVFAVQLTTPGGGATLDSSNTQASVTILANDSPLRWSQALVVADESGGSVQLTILRGQLEDGSSVGDLSVPTTVQVSTVAGSATSFEDFNPLNVTITFPIGSTSQTVSIAIVDDNMPEGDEMFTVELSSPSADSVLIPASTSTVIVPINDNAGGLVAFATPGPFVIQEDDATSARFIVQRTVGTLGDLTVEWEVTNAVDGAVATADFQPARGNVTIPHGESQTDLVIQAIDDSFPEVAEGFTVRLVRVAQGEGELSDTGIRLASLIVAESDDVYGLVEWAELSRLTVTSTGNSRNLVLAVTRGGGSVGTIAVDYSIVYLPPGQSDPLQGTTGVVAPAMGSIQIQEGQTSLQFNVPLMSDAFLEEGSAFYVVLDNTTLVGGSTPLIPAVNSPSLGDRVMAVVMVPPTALNGIIGFALESLQVSVEEPSDFPTTVQLTLTRSGSFGAAVITWVVTPINTDVFDIGANTGTVTFPSGSNTTLLEIFISPDDEPEIDEVFTVTLVSVSPSSQRINSDLNTAFVTIPENDDAAGIFSVSQGPLFIDETPTSVLQITIERSRGALTNVLLQYNIPGAENEIIGGFGLVNFVPDQTESNVSLLINDDDVPETNETYTFSISAVDGNMDVLGSPSSVDITILANDEYAGLFRFASDSLEATVAEPPRSPSDRSLPSTTTLTVMRDRGTFTDVSVTWQVTTPSAALDITPVDGVLVFTEGQTSASFQITALSDEIPEGNETLTVQLTGVSGDGRLASGPLAQSSLTILHNDDPISFAQSLVVADEGDTAALTINRGGEANGDAQVTYEVTYSTASTNDVTIASGPNGGVVNFIDGQTSAVISVQVLDDLVPEESEILTIRLVSVSGDAVLVTPTEATLELLPSDDPNGVFEFDEDSALLAVQEGATVDLMVVRSAGDFGTVDLRWSVWFLQNSSRVPADSADVSPAVGVVTFPPGNRSAIISFDVIDDALPELAETFEVQLSIFNIAGETDDGARIGDTNTSTLIVLESDDPYGLFSIARSNAELEIAEDVPASNPGLGTATVQVERMRGTIGAVRILWEVLPADVVLPSFLDLLFLGSRGTSILPVAGRQGTGTEALVFSGSSGSENLVTVPPQYHPDISNGFAISVWMQTATVSNGVLVAKVMEGSTLSYYGMSLVADSSDYLFQFSYLPVGVSTQQSVQVSFSQTQLPMATWHSLCVVVGGGTVRFYTNGVSRGSRSIGSTQLADGPGQLTVGGVATGSHFSGTLQDLRVYSAPLSESQVSAIAADEATASIIPISGYVDFSDGSQASSAASVGSSTGPQRTAMFSFSSVDDSIPEPSELFTVYLANSNGGSRIDSAQNSAQLTVLKSDGSNGVFGFDRDSRMASTSEPGTVSLTVNREEGAFDSVLVAWTIYQVIDGVASSLPAAEDFDPASGTLEFAEGERQQILQLVVADELVPELQEEFTVVLVTAVANDSEVSSTPFSGAYINTSISDATITVGENDYPYGLFQFVTSPPPPGVPIAPATVMPTVTVRESAGMVTVYVARAQGTVGSTSIEYFTSDGSATSQGVAPDFLPAAGRLDFSGDVIVRSFQVNLLDDSVAELGKTFYVNLTNPQGDVMVPSLSSVGSVLAVNIQPSDDAFGRFGFPADSQSRIVAEQQGGTPVALTVTRQGGRFGDVSVYWSVSQSGGGSGGAMDISPSEGVLEFSEGQTQMDIVLTVNDDLDAELLEVFTVQLINATAGASLGPVAMSTITVQANDHPYGRFVFTSAYRPLIGNSEGSEVEIVVTREFGTLGEVTVDFTTIAFSDLLTEPALDGVIDAQQFIDARQAAIDGLDFVAISGSLVFDEGVTSRSFDLSLLQDTTPEIDEYVFIAITNVQLNESSLDAVDTGALPSVAPGNDSVAFVVIGENDDARGVVQLSQSAVETPEPSQAFISVTREAGTFGEIVVQWETVPGTAMADDYDPSRGVVTLAEGVGTEPIPLSITDETVPEFSEQFTVRLVGVVGGARLGGVTSTMVTISASDNPNGALQFITDDRSVDVNEGSTQTPLTLTVERVGGAVGVVQVMWTLTRIDGGDPSEDILPTSGSLQFITNGRQQTITLTVLPDDLPEVDETFVVQLTNVTGGAVLEDNTLAAVTILRNDNPFGVISLQAPTAVTMEVGDNGTTVAMVPVVRELGTFGDIRVIYSLQPADAADLALAAPGATLFGYFSSPVRDFSLMPSAILRFLVDSTLEGCARACLSDQACLSFAHDATSSLCQLYLTVNDGTNSVSQTGPVYYEKLQAMVLPFYRGVATGGSDFVTAVGQSIVIQAGLTTAQIPVTIFGDATPELNESLVVTITGTEVVTSDEGSVSLPLLGNLTSTTLTILENDDPHGVFVVYGSGGSSEIFIGEPDTFSFGVMLTVERSRGTFGDVAVRWNLVDGQAVEGLDYAGSGMELRFADGEIRTTVALTILGDDEPEIDEDFTVTLTNPTGGSRVAPGNEGMTRIVIEANDGAAGVVSLAPLSRSTVVGEGESAALTLVRELSTFGAVEVEWLISGTSGGNASLEFVTINDIARFEEGDNETAIVVTVRADATPEIEERYTLNLISITTVSDVISPSGAAVLDSQGTTSSITIRASNNPHGVVQFQESSLFANSQDGMTVQFTVIREFGSFGTIQVTYAARAGNVTELAAGQSLATAGQDFSSTPLTVTLQDGQQSAVISVDVLEDDVPELEEVFLVELTSVTLLDADTTGIPPSLGVNTIAEVIVAPNDSPQGVISFAQETDTVLEGVGSVGVVISREQGSFGQVSAIYFVSGGTAVLGQDFTVSDSLGEVVFLQDQDTAVVNIAIVNDDLPEIDEEFCIQLRLPQGGATLGNVTTTCISILPNDDPYGVFSFDQSSLLSTISEPQGPASTANVTQLTVVRNRGLFEQVTVPYEVRQMGSQQGVLPVDLTPTMGALVFNPNDQTRVIQIEALMDDIPETDETFFVTLLAPPLLGRLSESATIATIIIQANQNPFGVVELSAVGVMGSEIDIEEDIGSIEFELTRSFGTFEEVSVTLETVPGTAISIPGVDLALDPLQTLDTTSADLWYSFSTSFGRLFLVLASGSQAVLYDWRGVYVPVQTLTTTNASGFTYVSPSRGIDLLVVTDRGSSGSREVISRVYRFAQEEQLVLAQTIPTQGASDVVSFDVDGTCYIVIANGEDNQANPNVDTIVYRWNGATFVQFQRLSTIGASALATYMYRGELNLAIASLTDTRSSVYVWISGRFRLDHNFATQRATDVVFLSLLGAPHLGVASETAGVSLLRMSESTEQFVFNRSLSSGHAARLEVEANIPLNFSFGDFVMFPPVATTQPSTTPAPEDATTTAAQVETTQAPVETTQQTLPPTTPPMTTPSSPPPTTHPPAPETTESTSPPTTLPPTTTEETVTTVEETEPPTTLPPTTLPPTTLPPTTLPPTTVPPTTTEEIETTVEETLPPTTLPPTTLPPTTLPPTTLPPTTTEEVVTMVVTDDDGKPIDPTTVDPNAPQTTMPPVAETTVPPTTLPPTTTEEVVTMVVTDDDGKPIDPTTVDPNVSPSPEPPQTTMPPVAETTVPSETTMPPTTTEEVVTMVVTDDDGKPINPTTIDPNVSPSPEPPQTTMPPVAETTVLPETTMPPVAETTVPPEPTFSPDTTQPPVDVTTDGKEEPTDYGGYGYDSDEGQQARRRRRNTFGAPPPSTATDTEFLVVTNRQRAGQIFTLVNGMPIEQRGVNVPSSSHLYPFRVGNSTYLAAAGVLQGQPAAESSLLFEAVSIDPQNTDYYHRETVLTLRPGEASLRFLLGIYDDSIPEIDENFDLRIANPMGGAVLGPQSSVTVTIQNNDDAHGVIGFSEESLSVVTPELDVFTTVNLAVVREAGLFGHVTVTWELSGDHSLGEVTPTSGTAVFPEGESEATITLVFQPDSVPELNEVTRVRLTSATVQGGGVNQPRIAAGRQEAVITVEANDAPHGVVSWSPILVPATETDGVDNTVQLTLVREFGAIGSIVISYTTLVDSSLPSEEQAQPLMDFIPTTSEVVIADNQTSATVSLTILHDNTPELDESFLVNITNVRLASEADRDGSTTNSPRLLLGGETATVQIQENDNSRGIVNFVLTSVAVTEEPGSSVVLELERTRGTFGDVGVNFVMRAGTASLEDVVLATGTVQFTTGQQRASLTIEIFNDAIPELDEEFTVELVSPSDGLQLGDQISASVTILANDDINGVFSFSNTSLLLLVSESVDSSDPMGVATLIVERSTSTIGEVVVYWEVSDDGLDDLEPTSGNLTFADSVTRQSFQVRAVADGDPELFEAFAVTLTSADGGGRIVDPRESRIAIRSSNDPSGVISLEQPPQGLLVTEGSELVVNVFRSAGTMGRVTATWAISPPDSSVFITTSDTIVFSEGETTASIRVQTLADQIPEVARLFSLAIVSTSFASIDVNASEVLVVVPASDNPHGLVEFDQAAVEVRVNEDIGTAAVSLQRSQGVIGTLRVNFSVVLLSSASSDDFSIATDYAIIPDGSVNGNITVTVVDDSVAELEERFSIILTSVEVVSDDGRDFDTGFDPSLIDEPPRIGPVATSTFIILPSDDPFGTISLTQARYDVVEGDTLTIPMVRTGGTLATVFVQYTSVDRRAAVNNDFLLTSGVLVFTPGQTMREIVVRIVDDEDPETEENFDVTISNPTLATLGSITSTTIFIDANDSPFGTVGFDDTSRNGIRISNPTVESGAVPVSFTVLRTPGANGQSVQTDVGWSVVRSPAGGPPITEDIDVSTTRGTLTITDGQTSGTIEVIVLPSSADEVEEIFTVSLTSTSNNVLIDSTRSQANVTVEQRGMPFGEISFLGEAVAGLRVNEQNENSTVSFSVARTGDLVGTLQVSFVVNRVGNSQDPTELDVLPAGGTFLFPAGVGRVSLELTVLADDVSEMDETFAVVLTESTGGAVINSQASTATLVIISNDAPFGEYGVSNAVLRADTTGSVISRTLSFDITRAGGNVGSTQVTVNITHDQNPSVAFVAQPVVRTLNLDQSSLTVSLPVNQDALLAPGNTVSLSVVRAEVTSPADLAGSLGSVAAPAQLVVGEDVANPVVFFDQRSLSASVNDSVASNNVMLTVNRLGQLGTVEVTWAASTIPGSTLSIGTTSPITNSFTLTPSNTSVNFTLTATPVEPHGLPEVFAIQLSVTSRTPMFAAGVDGAADLAIIEEWGVVELGGSTFTGLEGGMVAIPVWRRYGSRGSIRVTGVAQTSSSGSILPGQIPAQSGVDFPTSPISATLQDGETVGFINVPLTNNSVTSPIKVFTFQLTAVSRVPNPGFPVTSPRLSSIATSVAAQVSIIDDEGGAGLFQLNPTSAVVQEGSQFTFSVVRVQGNTGQLSVQLQTRTTGTATSGVDFMPLSQELVFGDRETTRSITVNIIDDSLAEEAEDFSVVLVEPPGGAAVIDPQAQSLALTIAPSDNPGGVFFFLTPSLALSEDLVPSGVLQVRRDSQAVGLFGRVEVAWEALYNDGATHPVSLDAILVNSRGTLVFEAGQTSPQSELTLQLNPNTVPPAGEQFVVRISSLVAGEIGLGVPSEVTVTAQPRTVAVFQISQQNLMMVVSSPGPVFISIERTNGLALETEVVYNTTQPSAEIAIGQVRFQPALAQLHFTSTRTPVSFASNQASRSVDVNIISVPETPAAFQVMISSQIHNISTSSATVVLVSDSVLGQLYPIYFNALTVTNSQQLNDVASSLYDLLIAGGVSGLAQNHSDTVQATISTLISKTATIDFSETDYVNTMLNVFQRIVSDITFEGHSQFVQLMKEFAYSLVARAPCLGAGTGQTYTRNSFYLEAVRLTPISLSNRRFSSSPGDSRTDYVQFPAEVISVSTSCVSVHFIEFFTENLFLRPTLRSKVLSVGVESEGIDLFPSSDQLIYRIYTDHSLGVLAQEDDCLFWQYPSISAGVLTPGSWGTSMCQPQSHFVNLENYVTCTCRQLGDLAAASVVDVGYGWTFPAAITAAIVIVAMLLVILIHLCYHSRTQLATKILINLCIAVAVFQLMLLIDILAGDSPNISDNGCAALGGLLQYTVLVQFVWIVALAVALWVNFMGFTDGREPLIFYILASWGLPIIIVVITILVWQFGVGRPLTELYGQRYTGGICFMPSLSASLLSTALPIILALLATVALLSHSCTYWSRWEDYDNIYQYSFNKVEIPLLVGLFVVISLSAVAGYLHAYIGVVYTFGIFCVINIIEALYAVIVYFFVSWHTLTRKHKYSLEDEVEPISIPDEPDYFNSMSTLASGQHDLSITHPSSKKKEIEMADMYEKDSDISSQVRSDQGGEVMTLGVRQLSNASLPLRGTSPVQSTEGEDSNLDDLMFMLKTQNYDDNDDSAPLVTPRRRGPKGEEHLELRRISIADTHL